MYNEDMLDGARRFAEQADNFIRKTYGTRKRALLFNAPVIVVGVSSMVLTMSGLVSAEAAYEPITIQNSATLPLSMRLSDILIRRQVQGAGSYEISSKGETLKIELQPDGLNMSGQLNRLRDASVIDLAHCGRLTWMAFAPRTVDTDETLFAQPEVPVTDCLDTLANIPQNP